MQLLKDWIYVLTTNYSVHYVDKGMRTLSPTPVLGLFSLFGQSSLEPMIILDDTVLPSLWQQFEFVSFLFQRTRPAS